MGLWANLPRIRAQRTLERLATSDVRLTGESLYDLVFLATGDEEQAAEALKARMAADLRAGRTPE